MAHVAVQRNPPSLPRRYVGIVERKPLGQGMPYLARFVTASAFPGLGTRAYGFLSG